MAGELSPPSTVSGNPGHCSSWVPVGITLNKRWAGTIHGHQRSTFIAGNGIGAGTRDLNWVGLQNAADSDTSVVAGPGVSGPGAPVQGAPMPKSDGFAVFLISI